MLTSALITLAQKECPDYSRVLLLSFLDEIQKIIFTQEPTEQMKMYSSTTGLDPVLTTTSGTYEYNINTTNGFSSNAWRTSIVYATDINEPEDVTLIDATPGTTYSKVVFKSNPSGNYYIRAYRFPASLTSEAVQLEIPSSLHLSHVYEGLLGILEQIRSGKSDRYMNFMRILVPDAIKRMSNPRMVTTVPYRPCG